MGMRISALVFLMFCLAAPHAVGDDVLYRYEGDVLPYAQAAGWSIFNACEDECSERLDNGHFALHWTQAMDIVNYSYLIASPADDAPRTLWVEWRFASNHPLGPYFYTCDARFSMKYGGMGELVFMYGDAAISFSGDDSARGLELNAFHTYRFESLNGVDYWISVDGRVFIVDAEDNPNGYHYLQFGGNGGCLGDEIPNMVNDWDFIRFGTISYGERIIASDPPTGFLDARRHAGLDRFTVTFDSANYAYLDEVSVRVTGGVTPEVTQTRRRENDGPETVEIVLDRPISLGETTRFTLNDGVAVNVIEYTFAPGDTDGDADADLFDVATFQNCFGQTGVSGVCQACDLDRNGRVNLNDFAAFSDLFAGP
jgi:hypothetical protein